MSYFPKIVGSNVKVYDSKTLSLISTLSCSSWGGVISATLSGEFVIVESKDKKTRIWHPIKGNIRIVY